MIHHLSIAARDPKQAAAVLAELMGGTSVPFPPNPGSFFALQLDEHGSGVEVYPAGTELEPGGEVGGSFVNVDGTWWIVLTAAETKEKREDERPVPEDLTSSIERYLQIYRRVLARGTAETDALWLAMDGKPMSYASMGELITENHKDDDWRRRQPSSLPYCGSDDTRHPSGRQAPRR